MNGGTKTEPLGKNGGRRTWLRILGDEVYERESNLGGETRGQCDRGCCTGLKLRGESEITLFFLKARGPRPTFATDMTVEERKVMGEHVAYWKTKLDEGKVLVFGPVLDPNEVFGIAIVDVKDEAEMRSLVANDPAVKAGVHAKDEFYPMDPRTFVRK